MPSCKGDKGEKGQKMPKILDLASTSLRRSSRLANKPQKKYSLFSKFSLPVVGAHEVAKNPHIFLTGANQHIQETNWQFDTTLNDFGLIVF